MSFTPFHAEFQTHPKTLFGCGEIFKDRKWVETNQERKEKDMIDLFVFIFILLFCKQILKINSEMIFKNKIIKNFV